ncbi:hypothetical protein ACFVJM_31050 [Streptomyces virginiae]|uniref:hypothetical protein n=1 Tax=Streptomyces virginiae TaxID=1961 RepID=UPI003632A4E7
MAATGRPYGRIAAMDNEMTVAGIAAVASLVGAGIGGAFAARGAGKQAAGAVEAGLAQAASAYLGPLDTARRTAQREAYVRLLTAAQEYAEAVRPVLRAARLLDRAEERAVGGGNPMPDEAWEALRERIDAVSDAHPVRAAAQHVALEGPGDVAEAAEQVRLVATLLEVALDNAGQSAHTDGGGVIPPHAHRFQPLIDALHHQITLFTEAAQEYLNKRDQNLGQQTVEPGRLARVRAFISGRVLRRRERTHPNG